MPKEKVNGRYAVNTTNEDDTSSIYVQVGWEKSGEYVEIATVFPKADLVMPSGAKTSTIQPGWFASLDRVGINDLIRKLRKARDDAFGRDE